MEHVYGARRADAENTLRDAGFRGPIVTEATKRGEATLAAAKGELVMPEPVLTKKKGRWLKRLAFVAVLGGIAVVVARRFLGSKDADWQAARPTAPYAPPAPPAPPAPAEPAEDASAAEAVDDPQGGVSAHEESLEANGETVPDQPAEGGDAVADAAIDSDESAVADEVAAEGEGSAEEAPADDDPTIAIDGR